MSDVIVQEKQDVAVMGAVTPMTMLQTAVARGATMDELGKLMDLQERWERNEARKAYHTAFAAFKAEAVQVIRKTDITNGPLSGRKYADLATAVDAATPMLSKHDLSASWKITKDEKDWIEATCTLTHIAGHSESAAFGGPPDSGGAKNAIQARASTLNYLQRYTFLAVCGLAAKNADDDGSGGKEEKAVKMPGGQKADFMAAIDECTADNWRDLWDKILAASAHADDRDELRTAMTARRKSFK